MSNELDTLKQKPEYLKIPYRDRIGNYSCENCSKSYSRKISSHKKSFKKYNKCLCGSCSKSIGAKMRWHNPEVLSSKIKIICGYCEKEFFVPYAKRDATFCSRRCQSRAVKKTDSRHAKECMVCGEGFKTYDGNANHCSRKCSYITSSKNRMGKNNPAWKDYDELDSSVCKKCKREFRYIRDGMAKGRKKVFCSKECQKGVDTRGITDNKGIIEQYPPEFRKIKIIRKNIDRNKCVFCNSKEKLEVHHIDYNKQNCKINNLLTLCKRCHTLTHYTRDFWQDFIENLYTKYILIKKPYGLNILDKLSKRKFSVLFKHHNLEIEYSNKIIWKFISGNAVIHDDNKKIIFNKNNIEIELDKNKIHIIEIKRNLILEEVKT